MRLALVILLGAWFSLAGSAKEAAPLAGDPVLEQRVLKLAEELRCLVCQNQTIADSHADLAVDLRNQIREKLKAGMSENDIKDYMVQRYGDFVLYRPPMKSSTALLWIGPFALLLVGAAVLFVNLRRRRKRLGQSEISEEDHQRALRLLDDGRADSR
jgi:cytochrome c-type biogenesis protein CcmH